VTEALSRARLWVAVNQTADGGLGIAEARSIEGARRLELYSHPLEVLAMRRDDRPAPMTLDQLTHALTADEGIQGVIVDPAGPWIELTRADLAPILAS
jgi:hypothetical protein